MFSETQKKIALKLLNQPLTAEEISSSCNFEKSVVEKELDEMKKMKLVNESSGKYFFEKKISEELQKRKTIQEADSFELRIRTFIEMQAIKKDLL